MTASELIDQIREAGGKLRVRDGRLYSKRIPERMVPELSEQKPEIVRHLRLEAARDPYSESYRFPSCPKCSSYALYRHLDVAKHRLTFKCQTCGLGNITESQARRIDERA